MGCRYGHFCSVRKLDLITAFAALIESVSYYHRFLIAAAVLLIAITVGFTFAVRTKDMPAPEPVSPTRHLDERRAAIYENLRDLQFEYRVGKLSDADYQQTKVGLQKELAGVLSEIERVNSGAPPVAVAAPKPKSGTECPHCNAKFAKPMKFCGECGKEIL